MAANAARPSYEVIESINRFDFRYSGICIKDKIKPTSFYFPQPKATTFVSLTFQ